MPASYNNSLAPSEIASRNLQSTAIVEVLLSCGTNPRASYGNLPCCTNMPFRSTSNKRSDFSLNHRLQHITIQMRAQEMIELLV